MMPDPQMTYAEFLLRTRAAALKQLLAIEAVALSQPQDDTTERRQRLGQLQETVDGT